MTNALLTQPKKLNIYLAHEFTHLLSLYLKLAPYQVLDKTWLEELRAEVSESLIKNPDFNFQESLLKNAEMILFMLLAFLGIIGKTATRITRVSIFLASIS